MGNTRFYIIRNAHFAENSHNLIMRTLIVRNSILRTLVYIVKYGQNTPNSVLFLTSKQVSFAPKCSKMLQNDQKNHHFPSNFCTNILRTLLNKSQLICEPSSINKITRHAPQTRGRLRPIRGPFNRHGLHDDFPDQSPAIRVRMRESGDLELWNWDGCGPK
jgi:hypothetical protein